MAVADNSSQSWCYLIEANAKENPDTPEKYLRLTILVLIALLSAFGNLTLVLSVIKQEKLRTITNIFVISHCLSDLGLIAVCIIPRLITVIRRKWCFGCQFCAVYGILIKCFLNISMVYLAILAMDRFFLIVRRLGTGWITKRAIYVLMPVVGVVSFLIYQPWRAVQDVKEMDFFIQDEMCFATYKANSGWELRVLPAAIFVIGLCLPLLVQLFCFYEIIQAMRTCKRKVRPLFSSTWYQIAAKVYAKSAYTILFVIALFVITSAPFSVVLFLQSMYAHIPYYTYTYTELLMFVSVALKPYVYITRSKHCRNPFMSFCNAKSKQSFPVIMGEYPRLRSKNAFQLRKTVPYIVKNPNSKDQLGGAEPGKPPSRSKEFYSVFSTKGSESSSLEKNYCQKTLATLSSDNFQ